jgi:hypothetical protein
MKNKRAPTPRSNEEAIAAAAESPVGLGLPKDAAK